MIISGLTHAALAPALLRFALCVATHAQGWLPAGWLAFTGRASNPLDRYERFPTNLVIPLSCPPVATTMNYAGNGGGVPSGEGKQAGKAPALRVR
jgi:hypothetical protein